MSSMSSSSTAAAILLGLLCLRGLPSAMALSEDILAAPVQSDLAVDDGEDDGRTFFTSNGNYFLTLNTTYLLLYAGLLGAGLLAALAISSLFNRDTSSGYGGYGYAHQGGGGGYGGQSGHGHYRNKRSDWFNPDAGEIDHAQKSPLWRTTSYRTASAFGEKGEKSHAKMTEAPKELWKVFFSFFRRRGRRRSG
jgi:hypothetical protein